VLCAKCKTKNPDGLKFCNECGAPFKTACASCGFENALAAKFCGQCGAALRALAATASAKKSDQARIRLTVAPVAENLEGERKTVTVLFADIKGSMELIEDLDPEEARAIVDPALKLMIDAVHHYGGYVAQSTGDGIFALFGAPIAHEDHPQRALLAALRMQEELKRYSDRIRAEGRLPIQARVGVNTGEVVVRSLTTGEGRTDYAPVGHSTGIAARMQALSPVGSIAATEQLRKLCEGYFLFRSLGPTKVKGVSEPVNVYEVTGLGTLRTRLQRAAGRGYTKFVGRRREMEAIKHASEQAKAGHGQIVAVMADAGVGKSRLFFEFKATSQSGWLVLEAPSFSHGKATAYLPVLDLLHGYFRITPDDDQRTRREKVNGRIVTLDPTLEDTRSYLFALLGIFEGEDPLAQMDANIRKRRTHDAVKRILLRESLNQPLMLIFEDLHWIDEETQAFLNQLGEGIANAPVLLLTNYRPEYSHPWGSKTYYTQLRLDPLGKDSADEMLSALVGDSPELAPLRRLVLERTEGNPLFMEELVEALFEEGVLVRNGAVELTKPLGQLKIPPTVQGILAARIDRLPPEAKELLQTLAVIGMEFPTSLVCKVVQEPPDQVDHLLGDLQTGEFIYEQPASGDVEYTFKHALTHDVAYNSLLTERRKAIHERTAQAIEALYSERLEDRYSDLARHYRLSNDATKAISYLQLAAMQARDRAAYTEAHSLIDAGLRLLDKLPEAEERLRAELGLRTIESVVSFVLHGGSSPKRDGAITRGCEIAESLGEHGQMLLGLVNRSSLHWLRGQPAKGLEVAERCLELRHLARDPDLLADIYWMAAVLSESCGRLREAVVHYERSLEVARDAVRAKRPFSPTWGILHAIMTDDMACATLQLLGRIGEAIETAERAFQQARSSQHAFTLCHALLQAGGWFSFVRREPGKALKYGDELIALSEQNGFAEWPSLGLLFRGWALTYLGELDRGVAEMERGAEAMKRNGTVWPLATAQLAYGYARIGQSDRALSILELILTELDRNGWLDQKSETLRIKGEALLMRNHAAEDEAESCFRAAIDLARTQEAKWWELRATTSLAHLLRDTNRRDEARAMLAEIYSWFTEGFDTADLKDAKALLDELQS
jgi:class 3 adenylate cyclase/tetratricopeptide (TPR) repeat protein